MPFQMRSLLSRPNHASERKLCSSPTRKSKPTTSPYLAFIRTPPIIIIIIMAIKRSLCASLSMLALAVGQQAGTEQTETHPNVLSLWSKVPQIKARTICVVRDTQIVQSNTVKILHATRNTGIQHT